MKKFIFAVLAAALFMGAGVGVSYAYLTAKDDAANHFRVSSVDIKIEEDFDPPPDVVPGQVITKAPCVVSNSDTECYVRMSVHFSDSRAEGFCEPLQINDGWADGGDGYFYWGAPLAPGEKTGTLFDSVTIRQDAGDNIPQFEILVYAEAVLCGDLSMEEAWKEAI